MSRRGAALADPTVSPTDPFSAEGADRRLLLIAARLDGAPAVPRASAVAVRRRAWRRLAADPRHRRLRWARRLALYFLAARRGLAARLALRQPAGRAEAARASAQAAAPARRFRSIFGALDPDPVGGDHARRRRSVRAAAAASADLARASPIRCRSSPPTSGRPFKAVLVGYAVGCLSGFLVAILADRFDFLRSGLLPIGNMVSRCRSSASRRSWSCGSASTGRRRRPWSSS